MKFSTAVVLTAFLIGCVSAGEASCDMLHEAVKKSDLGGALEFLRLCQPLREEGTDYVVSSAKDPNFIVEFINQAKQTTASTLDNLCHSRTVDVVEKVLEGVKFPQRVLIEKASSYNSVRNPKLLVVLLRNIRRPEDQERAVEKAIIGAYAEGRRFCFNSLMNALKGKTFRSERLEMVMLQSEFKVRAIYTANEKNILEYAYKHSAITPEVYAEAITLVEKRDFIGYSGREWLIERADLWDLQAATECMKNCSISRASGLHAAVEKAMKTAQPGGTRTRVYDIQTAEKTEEVFGELGSLGISQDSLDIVVAYLAFDAPTPKRRAQIANMVTKVALHKFYAAIAKRDLATSVELYQQNESVPLTRIIHVIDTLDPDFISKFINQAGLVHEIALCHLCLVGSEEIIKTVLDKVEFPQQYLVDEATQFTGLVPFSEKLHVVLSKVTSPEDQEAMVESQIALLFSHGLNINVASLIASMRGKTFRSGQLKAIAALKAFQRGVEYASEDILAQCFGHRAITPQVYADALVLTGEHWDWYASIREWLLKRADISDLMAVRTRKNCKALRPEFQAAIQRALQTAKAGGNRFLNTEKIEMCRQVVDEVLTNRTPTPTPDIGTILDEYLGQGNE